MTELGRFQKVGELRVRVRDREGTTYALADMPDGTREIATVATSLMSDDVVLAAFLKLVERAVDVIVRRAGHSHAVLEGIEPIKPH